MTIFTVPDSLITSVAELEYARVRPEAPSRIPPKYLVTTTAASVTPAFSIASRTGIPAVPFGSPSSENRLTGTPPL